MTDDKKISVLVVDDEQAIRWSLAEYLEDFDFIVSTAENGEEALKLICEKHFDVGIIDLRLPGMSGESLIEKAHGKDDKIKFIIHTGSSNYELSKELLEIGMDPEYVLLKPLQDLTVLIEKINKLL
jgi:two-component system, OmpR family, response regulator